MKYIIMCGGDYKDQFNIPKPLLEVAGEKLVERTIRLLRENGITDIAISTGKNTVYFNYLDVELLKKDNTYIHDNPKINLTSSGCWLNAYYLMDKPCCYLPGDVYYSEESIKKIINTPVKNTMFFCIPDRKDGRTQFNIKGREPLAYKVQNNKLFNKAVKEMKQMIDDGKFKKDPISWHLYRYINGVEMQYDGFGNDIFKTNGDFITIDDYTTDIDMPRDIPKIEKYLEFMKGGYKMVRVQATDNFHLDKFKELLNVQRNNPNLCAEGYLYVDDTFYCTDEMAKYLLNEEGHENPGKKAFIKKIPMEVIPEEKEIVVEEKKEVKEEKPKATKKTTTKKRKSIEKK